MANVRVRSTDGSNSDNGTTWALAKLDLHTATTGGLATAGAGGTCYVSQAHAGSYAGTITYTTGGTLASPVKVICGNDGADPPTSLATTATESTSGNGFAFTGSAYFYGITFTSTYAITQAWEICAGYTAPYDQTFEQCAFNAGAGNAGGMYSGYSSASANDKGSRLVLKNCTIKLPASTAATFTLYNTNMTWVGGSFVTNSTLPNYLFTPASGGFNPIVKVIGVDLSALSGKTLVNSGNAATGSNIQFINCKLPASITLSTTPQSANQRVALYNSDSGDTNYRMEIQTYAGAFYSETTLVRTGGASDGTTTLSWKAVTNANAEFPHMYLESDPIYVWNSSTGSSKTLTIELLHDSVTNLTDQEVWLDVAYAGTSGFPIASFNDIDNPLSSESDLSTSSETWTTTGMSNPNKQYVSVSFTPQEVGYIAARVRIAKASKTLYIDPKLTIA